MTERLYYHDSYLRRFQAQIVQQTTVSSRPTVVLDRTAFYPTSGGQPNDTGTLNDVPVVDVVEDEASGSILHILEHPLGAGGVEGEINWQRRFDHMQQHSGQHVLSQAFDNVLAAPTVSFHLGSEVSTIDVQLAGPSAQQAALVEDMANSTVFAGLPVHIHEVAQADLGRFPLRKPPVVTGTVRIIEVDGFDFSACGGTHVRAAGEIGLIKIRRWERRGDTQRIEFVCGQRALLDYRWKNEAVVALAAGLNVKDRELQAAVERQFAQARDTHHLLEDAQKRLLELEARAMIAETPIANGLRLVVRTFDDRNGEEVRRLAMALAAAPATVALFGLRSSERASLVFARSADLPHDMNALLRQVAPIVAGRGGGTPSLAQGGGPGIAALDAALDAAQQQLRLGK